MARAHGCRGRTLTELTAAAHGRADALGPGARTDSGSLARAVPQDKPAAGQGLGTKGQQDRCQRTMAGLCMGRRRPRLTPWTSPGTGTRSVPSGAGRIHLPPPLGALRCWKNPSAEAPEATQRLARDVVWCQTLRKVLLLTANST